MSLPKPLPGLLPAAFRGIGFYVADAASEAGRRFAAHYFPGLDIAAYDDLGKRPEKISLSGFYIGADYISHGKALKLAFEQPGAGTLMHPHFGAIRVILSDTAKISFSAQELRMVRFEAEFERAQDNILAKLFSGLGLGSVPKLISAGLQLSAQAQFMVSLAGNMSLSRLFSDAAMRVGGSFFTFAAAMPGQAAAIISAALPSAPPGAAAGFAAMLDNVSKSLVAATVNEAVSAVAPAAGAVLPAPALKADEAVAAALPLAASITELASTAPSQTDAALIAALSAGLLGAAAQISPDIAPAGRRRALALREQINGGLEAYSNSLQTLFESPLAEGASRLSRAALAARLAAVNDINETIGRLPATAVIELAKDADAWAIAHMLYGDDLQNLEAAYEDLISRNGLAHPALIPAGKLEVLA